MKILLQLSKYNDYTPLKYFKCTTLFDLKTQQMIVFFVQSKNFTHPEIKIFCSICNRICQNSEISILVCQQNQQKNEVIYKDLCLECFYKALISNESRFSGTYFVRSPNSYSLTDPNWRVCDDVLFLKSIEKEGFGNWDKIKFILETYGCFVKKNQLQRHFKLFLKADHKLKNPVLSENFLRNTLSLSNHASSINFPQVFSFQIDDFKGQNENISENQENYEENSYSQTSSQNLPIYNSLRDDFLISYDPYAQSTIADMEFRESDTEQEIQLKQDLLKRYNQRLRQRRKRHRFVTNQKLFPLGKKEQKYSREEQSSEQNRFFLQQPCEGSIVNQFLEKFKYLFQNQEDLVQMQKLMNKYQNLKNIIFSIQSLKKSTKSKENLKGIKLSLEKNLIANSQKKISWKNRKIIDLKSKGRKDIPKYLEQELKKVQQKLFSSNQQKAQDNEEAWKTKSRQT